MPVWLILSVTGLYVAVLFALAWRGDRASEGAPRPIVYALALAVYCTSWTFYGAVGTAVAEGWDYLPIYLGPALVFLVFPGMIRRIGNIARRESVTSLSDFLAARYGKSRALGAIVTVAAVAGSLPYIALQLKSVAMSFQALAGTGQAGHQGPAPDMSVLAIALALAVFAILFGARHADTTRRHAGLMQALAFESLVKLVALGAVAMLSIKVMGTAETEFASIAATPFRPGGGVADFLTITFLAMAAILCLPRQFHVAVIERGSERDVDVARWAFPLYLAMTSLVVIPITLAGMSTLPADVQPDLYVLALPLTLGQEELALLVFLGGFSAASAMVIVASVALATMVTNDLVVPVLMRSGRIAPLGQRGGQRLVAVRRGVILLLLLLAYTYYRVAGGSEALAQIGLLSFAAAIQFAPALLAAVYWRAGHRDGAIAGVAVGILIWAYTLFLPALIGIETLRAMGLSGPLDPYALAGSTIGTPLTHGVAWSLLANTLVFIGLSLRARVRLRDRIQASVFTQPGELRPDAPPGQVMAASGATPDGLKALAARFLAREAVDHAFARFERESGMPASGDAPADWQLVQRTERLLASALGAASARIVMGSALAGSAVSLGDVLSILDQKTQAERFDRHMLQSMLENVAQGISVVDHEQRLVAWNSTYVEMFQYPSDLVRTGRPVGDLIAHNIARGWIDAGDPHEEINRRVAHMQAGAPHAFERENPDGTWLRIVGSPMPGGGYVTTFTDITQDKRRERTLIELNETLEARVEARTHDLQVMASDLDTARREADRANLTKTRFLAAASHDLLQPLNAARLYLGTLKESGLAADQAHLVTRSDRAIQSADELLRGLLDISRLDQGDLIAQSETLPANALLEDLVEEASPMAEHVGLELRMAPTSLRVRADAGFLQSILRNFVSNARRYTETGAILVGARRRGDVVRFEVWDTGPGIPEDRCEAIFEAFRRFEDVDNTGLRGAGLGLAIARRLAEIMKARIGVRSRVGRGSVFYIEVPRAESRRGPPSLTRSGAPESEIPASGLDLDVLCVDDERDILDAMKGLLTRWGCRVHLAHSASEAKAIFEHHSPAILLVDFQLSDGQTGFELVDFLHAHGQSGFVAALVSASPSAEVREGARRRGMDCLAKPINASALRALLTRLQEARTRG